MHYADDQSSEGQVLEVRVGYRWPASRLTERHRRMLCQMSNHTKKPINELIAESIELMYAVFESDH